MSDFLEDATVVLLVVELVVCFAILSFLALDGIIHYAGRKNKRGRK